MKQKLLLPVLLLFLCFVLSGCFIQINSGGDTSNGIGGVFKTADQGDVWQQKNLIPTTIGRPGSISGLDANSLVMDPSDSKALYFASVDNGLYFSYDGGENWQIAQSLGKVNIDSVAVDPNSKCIIFASSGNKIFKSSDCSRSWEQIYYDNDANARIKAIAVDYYDSKILYAGISRGDIIKSYDRGASWQPAGSFKDEIKKIFISPFDSRIVFAATTQKGIQRSKDGGASWDDLKDSVKSFKNGTKYKDMAVCKADGGSIFIATYYGILKSADNGDSWSEIQLITPAEASATINAIAVNPDDAKEIYYATNTTFYRSLDGGENWTTKKLPTARAAWQLLIDPKNAKTLYMTARSLKK